MAARGRPDRRKLEGREPVRFADGARPSDAPISSARVVADLTGRALWRVDREREFERGHAQPVDGSDARGARLRNLERINARSADLSRSRSRFASLKGADLTGASLEGRPARRGRLNRCHGPSIRFRCADLVSASLSLNWPRPGKISTREKSRPSDQGMTAPGRWEDDLIRCYRLPGFDRAVAGGRRRTCRTGQRHPAVEPGMRSTISGFPAIAGRKERLGIQPNPQRQGQGS